MSMAVAVGGSSLSVVIGYSCVAVVFACRYALGVIGVLPAPDTWVDEGAVTTAH